MAAIDLADITLLQEAFPLVRLAALKGALARASGAFIDAVGWPVLDHTGRVVLHGDGGRVLHLPVRQVRTASVSIDGADPLVAVESGAGIRLDGRLGVLVRDDGWPRGLANIVVEYRAGWDVNEIPEGISDAVLERAGSLLTGGATQIQAGPFSASFGGSRSVGVTQTWSDTVARYAVGVGDRA